MSAAKKNQQSQAKKTKIYILTKGKATLSAKQSPDPWNSTFSLADFSFPPFLKSSFHVATTPLRSWQACLPRFFFYLKDVPEITTSIQDSD